jgi:large subunit ribosomal protein L15
MKLNEIHDNPGARYKAKRVGRGIGSGKGKTAGSGTKGQKSRTGVAINGFEGGQMPIHRRLPKRGFTNIFREVHQYVNLGVLQQFIDNGKINPSQPVTKELLRTLGLVSSLSKPVKLLAKGTLSASLSVEVDAASAAASAAIEKLGGKIIGLVS